MNQIEWYSEDKQVVLHTYYGETTWEDFIEIATRSASILQSVDYPVQIVVDRTQAFFKSFDPIKMRPLETKLVPGNQDLVIVIGAQYMVETLSEIVGSLVAPRAFSGTYYVATMTEAHKILKQERGIDLE